MLAIQHFYSGTTRAESGELRRRLQKQGRTFESGHGRHPIVGRSDKMSILLMHGKGNI